MKKIKRISNALFEPILNCEQNIITGGETRTMSMCDTPTEPSDQYGCGDYDRTYTYDGSWADVPPASYTIERPCA